MDNFIFATVLMGLVGMLLGVIGILVEFSIVFYIGFVLVAVGLIGLIYMWLLK
jgi:hypothetical protein